MRALAIFAVLFFASAAVAEQDMPAAALIAATKQGDFAAVDRLLGQGVDPDLTDSHNNTALVRLLLDRGAASGLFATLLRVANRRSEALPPLVGAAVSLRTPSTAGIAVYVFVTHS